MAKKPKSYGGTVSGTVAVRPAPGLTGVETGHPDDWSWMDVQAALLRAAATLQAMPPVTRRARLSQWPDYVRSYWTAYDSKDAPPIRPPAPSPAAIDELDRVLDWLLWIEGDADRGLVVARMHGVKWLKLRFFFSKSEPTLRKRHRGVLMAIARRLNARQKKAKKSFR